MSNEILDDLDEIEGKAKPIIFAKKAINNARLSAMLYVLGAVLPGLWNGFTFGSMSNLKIFAYSFFFMLTGFIAIFAVVNAVKSILQKEHALIKKYVALIIGIFVTYMCIVTVLNFFLLTHGLSNM